MAQSTPKQPSSRPGTNYTFTLSGSHQETSPFSAQCNQIRVATGGQPAWVSLGDNPVATATASMLMNSALTEYFTTTPGQRLSCLQAGTAGSLTVTEMS
jgi:hypothetical protein